MFKVQCSRLNAHSINTQINQYTNIPLIQLPISLSHPFQADNFFKLVLNNIDKKILVALKINLDTSRLRYIFINVKKIIH